jgi:hypothetical protein
MADYRKVEMFLIIDRSGSMGKIKADAIGGYNQFVTDQKQIPGEAIANLLLFDNEMLLVKEGVDISELPMLDNKNYVPRGSTALFDAIHLAVEKIKSKYKDTPTIDIPAILFMILTDGEENASRIITSGTKLKEIITRCRSFGWEFIFLAADQDAFSAAENYGISKGNTMNFSTHLKGDTVRSFAKMSSSTTKFRSAGLSDVEYRELMDDNDTNTK